MNNQGLEALAALAAAAPASATPGEEGKTEDTSSSSSHRTAPDLSALTANLPAHIAAQLQANPQQLQQLRNSAAFGQQQAQQLSSAAANPLGAPDLSALLAASGSVPQLPSANLSSALQNMAYQQLLLQSMASQTAASAPPAQNPSVTAAATHLASLLGLGQGTGATNHALLSAATQSQDAVPHAAPSTPNSSSNTTTQQLAQAQANLLSSSTASAAAASSAMPPPPPSAPTSPPVVAAPSTTGRGPAPSLPRSLLAPNPPSSVSSQRSSRDSIPDEEDLDDSLHPEDKKEQKRAANRRSAQLSRKRKKQFIEELKDENDELRRKEQILKSIPDLVVVFDSTGKLWFVSQSISRFIQYEASELEGRSFWERLCPDSVRQLKAAFMDSLAARESHTDTVPLGAGLWDLRLLDKDGTPVTVTLNGVVHFAGERPECVCCIRPKDSSALPSDEEERPRAVQRQAMVSDESTALAGAQVAEKVKAQGRDAIRISDSGHSSGSGDSVSGSSDD
uniref:PAS domain-containing protein n=1 Tax=Entomoneis paludosa TaxID=265537 RepID=A0A7S2YS82_9STRA|mmetsp:Transcript_7969/g.16609  ORF Transcript_7969/g.16609 Transcript_7969/m.16609 type:complete len:508 (+) Transcript_7969:286-1809(+)